jgi:hypothetical protein
VETGIQENSNYLTRLFIFQLSKYLDENILSLIIFYHVGRPKQDATKRLENITIPTTGLFGGIGKILGVNEESHFILVG